MAATEQGELNTHLLLLDYPNSQSTNTSTSRNEASGTTMVNTALHNPLRLAALTAKTQTTGQHVRKSPA